MSNVPQITHPAVQPNLTRVEVADVVFWFSYETVVAFHKLSYGGELTVSENVWGATTGKHLNHIDGGSKEAKARRLSAQDFQHEVSHVSFSQRLV